MAGCRVECGTSFIIRKIGKPPLRIISFVQYAADRVAGKICRHARNRISSPRANSRSSLRRARFKLGEAAAQSRGIELIDGENSNAALRASRAANQPFAAASRD